MRGLDTLTHTHTHGTTTVTLAAHARRGLKIYKTDFNPAKDKNVD